VEDRGRNDALLIIGAIVLVIGLVALANTFSLVPPVVWDVLRSVARAAFPVTLIILGVVIILVATRGGGWPSLPAAGVRLYRSRNNRMIAGVAGGIAEYLRVDPLLVRLVFVLVGLASLGSAVLAYVLLVILMPDAPVQEGETDA
jgi:phage shock protein C